MAIVRKIPVQCQYALDNEVPEDAEFCALRATHMVLSEGDYDPAFYCEAHANEVVKNYNKE